MGILDTPGYSRSAIARALTRQRSSIIEKSGYGAAKRTDISDGTNICMNCRYQHTAPISGYSLVYVYGNFMNLNGGEVDSPNDLTVRAAQEWSSGLIIPVRFGGKRSGTVEAGGLLYSDPIGVTQDAGSTFWSRTNVSATPGRRGRS